MGCGTSRLEPHEEISIGLMSFRRRVQELKRKQTEELRLRQRRDSIVSTTELLRPEERDDDECDVSMAEEMKRNGSQMPDSSQDQAAEGKFEEEGRRIGFGKERSDGVEAEEELVGSPSFRFYFADAVKGPVDNESVVESVQDQKEEKFGEKKELLQEQDQNDSLASGDVLALKASKKEKTRKFIALPKPNFLNVRGCYNMNSSSLQAQEGSRILSEKAI